MIGPDWINRENFTEKIDFKKLNSSLPKVLRTVPGI